MEKQTSANPQRSILAQSYFAALTRVDNGKELAGRDQCRGGRRGAAPDTSINGSYWNSSGANSFRYSRQLIHVCPPGDSFMTGLNPCFFSISTVPLVVGI